MLAPGHTFGLRIQGDSLGGAGLRPGDDVLFVQQTNVARGQLACVMLSDEAAVRYVYADLEYVQLVASSAATPAVLLRAGDWNPRFVLGVAVGMLRRYDPPAAPPA